MEDLRYLTGPATPARLSAAAAALSEAPLDIPYRAGGSRISTIGSTCHAWHGEHHVAHLTALERREGW